MLNAYNGSLFLTQEKMAVMDEMEQVEERFVSLVAILLRMKVKRLPSNQTNIVWFFFLFDITCGIHIVA